jgi:spore cortex formation protein SpoVR/YcgB (stage V sporulation)
MDLKTACIRILDQMTEVIEQINDEDFIKPSQSLSRSTLGQHFRHAIEFFECLAKGQEKGVISYDHRDHDENIERSRVLAVEVIRRIKSFIAQVSVDQKIKLEVGYSHDTDSIEVISSNMAREIVYNIEHVVHHMALVKIGIKEIIPGLELPEDFGVAVSTIKYQRSQS